MALSSCTALYDNPIGAAATALDGVDTLVSCPATARPPGCSIHHHNVVQAATQCRVGHVVLLSGLDVDLQSPFCYAYTNGDTERLLRASGRPKEIVRASLFTEFFLSLLPQMSTGDPDGTVALPAADGRVSLVAREDVARCLAALAVEKPTGRHHNVTGPTASPSTRSPRWPDTGTPRPHRPSSPACSCAAARNSWWTCNVYTSMFESIRQGRWETMSDAVASRPSASPTGLATPGAESR